MRISSRRIFGSSIGLLIIALAVHSCKSNEEFRFEESNPPEIHKWLNNRKAALSITYDSGWPISTTDKETQRLVKEYGLTLSYEIVSYQMPDIVWNYFRDVLIPDGFGIFGHGHMHIDYDNVSYGEAKSHFDENFSQIAQKLNVRPISYAYPFGYGYAETTNQALSDAGFMAARLHHNKHHADPYIVPDDIKHPENWFQLPCLVMQDIHFDNFHWAINDTQELVPYLDGAVEKKAWIITAYHSIGETRGWGYYTMENFANDLFEIRNRDIWSGTMDEVVKYIKQRESAKIEVDYSKIRLNKIVLKLIHDLDMDLFDQPMTVSFEIPKIFIGKDVSIQTPKEDFRRKSGQFNSNHQRQLPKLSTNTTRMSLTIQPSAISYELTFY